MPGKSSQEINVGQVIKSLRNKRNLSLRNLSNQSGVSINAISKIEHGENSPTVATLHKLASALDVQITEFFPQKIHQCAVFVKSEDSTFIHSGGTTIESLGSGLPHQQLQPYKMIVYDESKNDSEFVSHFGEEFIYCLSGKIMYFVGEEQFLLEPGDKLLFKANRPHRWINVGEDPAEVILILETNQNGSLPHKIY